MFDSTAGQSPFPPSAEGLYAADARHETPQSKLIAAASAGDVGAIGRALAEPAPRLDLDHPLRLAAKHRHGDAVRFLIARGANVVRAFSPNHTPTRCGKREQLVRFLASCGVDAEFILAQPRPRGQRPHRAVRTRAGRKVGERRSELARRRAAEKREAWAKRVESQRLRRVLKHHNGLLAEILGGVDAEGARLEHAVHVALAARGIGDHKRHLAKAILHTLRRNGYAPAAEGA